MLEELCKLSNDILYDNNIYYRYIPYCILFMLFGIFITIIPSIFIYFTNNQNLISLEWMFFILCSIITCPIGYIIFTLGFTPIIIIISRILNNKILNNLFQILNLYLITDKLLLLSLICILVVIIIFSIYSYPIGFIIFIICFVLIIIFIYIIIKVLVKQSYRIWNIYIITVILLIILLIILLLFLILIVNLIQITF